MNRLSDFDVTFDAASGVARSQQTMAKRGTTHALSTFDTKFVTCDTWHVTVKLLASSNRSVSADTHPHAPGFEIHVYTHSPGWFLGSSVDREVTMLHEWYHVVEFSEFDCSLCEVSSPPDWLIEGSAVYESYRAADRLHLGSYGALRARQVFYAKLDHTPLQSLAKATDNASDYSVAFLAVENLVRRKGDTSLERFWTELGDNGAVQRSFQDAFGVGLDEFYDRFAQARANGFPS